MRKFWFAAVSLASILLCFAAYAIWTPSSSTPPGHGDAPFGKKAPRAYDSAETSEGVILAGTVTSTDGKPISGATLAVLAQTGASARSSADGSWSIELQAQPPGLLVTARGYAPRLIHVEEGDFRNIEVTLAAC